MNMKNSKRLKGFMCHSPAATAVCLTANPRSVIVPKRPDRTLVDSTRILSNPKYSKLIHSHRLNAPPSKRPVFVPSITREAVVVHKPSSHTTFQVVVMKVGLHCQGCAGKVKRHLAKMEGVTSFSIDLETKRVTVMGHISPVGVLESISKVKRAEFWTC